MLDFNVDSESWNLRTQRPNNSILTRTNTNTCLEKKTYRSFEWHKNKKCPEINGFDSKVQRIGKDLRVEISFTNIHHIEADKSALLNAINQKIVFKQNEEQANRNRKRAGTPKEISTINVKRIWQYYLSNEWIKEIKKR